MAHYSQLLEVLVPLRALADHEPRAAEERLSNERVKLPASLKFLAPLKDPKP